MHYRIITVGPIRRDHLTDTLLTYLNYPGYLSPNRPNPTVSSRPTWPSSPGLGKGGQPNGSLTSQSNVIGQPWARAAGLGKVQPSGGGQAAFKPSSPPGWLNHSSSLNPHHGREAGVPMMSQTGNPVQVAPGIELRLLSNMGRTYHDTFIWVVGINTYLLEVVHQGAYHHWQRLPRGWDNQHLTTAPIAELGTFKPGGGIVREVASMTTAQKVGEAMYRSLNYVGEEARPILLELISPETIGYAIALEGAYAVSMFFGVGEVLTAVLVVAGVYFVGQQVKDILESLVGFVRRATTAQSEPDLEAAAKLFAHALTLSVDIVVSLLKRKARPTGQGSTVLRAKASGGSGGKRPTVLLPETTDIPASPRFTKPSSEYRKPAVETVKSRLDGSENKPYATSREARRETMRKEGIPTSQQPVSQTKNQSGYSYEYEMRSKGGGKDVKSVQQQTMDRSHEGKPHWEAGAVKTDPRTGEISKNKYGRPKLKNPKSKAHYEPKIK